MVQIYHNPRCSKSRQTLQLLKDRGIEPEIIEYLKNPPDVATLTDILARLCISPQVLIRTGEAVYKDLKLDDPAISDAALIQTMVDNPILIERPIVVNGDKAALGRPPEAVLDIL